MAFQAQNHSIFPLGNYFKFILLAHVNGFLSKRGLSTRRKWLCMNQIISWLLCWLLWCERRRHVRRDAEVDRLGHWRRQRQVQASQRTLHQVPHGRLVNFNGDIDFFGEKLMHKTKNFGQLHNSYTQIFSEMTSTIRHRLRVRLRHRPRPLLPPPRPLHCNYSSKPRRR